MRKLLSLFAAVSCMMFMFVTTAHATLPDVTVDGVALTSSNIDDVLGDGTVKYDEPSQTLVLKNADITDGIEIDASALTGPFTIKVEGTNWVTKDDGVAIWYKKGEGLVISGTADDDLTVKSLYNSGGSHHAIYCGLDESSWSYASVLTVTGGLHLYVDNYASDGAYSAIGCDDYVFNKSSIVIVTHDDEWPISTFSAAHLLDHVSFINQLGTAYGYPFEVGYPVWINGMQMSDGLPKAWSTGLPYISGFEMKAITSGALSTITYNPETRELILDYGVVLEADNYHAIEIHNTEDPSAAITIKRGPTFTSNPTEIISKLSGYNALHALTPVIVDANGHSMRFVAENSSAFVVEDKLTLTNTDWSNDETAELTIFGEAGSAVTSVFGNGELIIDRVEMNIFGSGEVISQLANVEMKPGLNFAKPDDYEFAGGALVEKGTTNIVTWDQLFFVLCGWYFDAVANPAGAGTFVFKNSADEVKPLPYLFTADEDVTIEAVGNPGWDFYNWPSLYGNTQNPLETSVSTYGKKNILLTAKFSRLVESNETFYAVSRDRYMKYLANKLRWDSYTKGTIPELTSEETKIDGAVVGNGMLYFIERDNTNFTSALGACQFDGEKVTGEKAVVAAQTKYDPIRAIVFNNNDKKIYMVAYDNDEHKDKVLSVDPAKETAFTEVGEIPAMLNFNIRALAFNKANELYALADEMGVMRLYTLDPATLTETPVADMVGLTSGLEYYECAMTFSPATDELIIMNGSDLYLANISAGEAEWIAQGGYSCSAIFVGTDRYKVSVHPQSGQEYWGWVELTGGYTEAYFLPFTEIQAYAKPDDGYSFVKWADGSTDNPRDYTVPEAETELVAVFAEITKHTISVDVNDPSLGYAVIQWYGSPYDAYEGQELSLRAFPNSPFQGFVQWDDGNTDNPRKIIVGTEDKTYTAIFENLPTHTITVTADPNGTAEVDGWGSPAIVPEGVEVNLIATPSAPGYVFDKWDEDDVTDNPRTIKVTEDATYTALFKAGVAHTITVEMEYPGEYYGDVYLPGHVTSAEYAEGTLVQIEVVVKDDYIGSYVFDHWTDLADTDPDYSANPRTIEVKTADATYTAVMKALPMQEIHLLIEDGQEFWGKVECVEDGNMYIYAVVGSEHQILATPINENYEFVNWYDDFDKTKVNTDNPRTVTVADVETHYTAVFQKKSTVVKHHIAVAVATGQDSWGSVVINECSCTEDDFEEGATLTLTAEPTAGHYFVGWSYGATDLISEYIVGTADATLTATFGDAAFVHHVAVEIPAAQTGWGTVEIADCSCTEDDFVEGQTITLKAEPSAGHYFVEWNDGNVNATRTYVVGTADATLTATFAEGAAFTITLAVATGQESMGTVWLPGGVQTNSFKENAEVEINAKANAGFRFVKWDDANTEAKRTITVTEDKTYVASFEVDPDAPVYPVTVAGVTLNEEKATLIAGSDLAGILKAGSITYDPATNTLILNNVELEFTDDAHSLTIDGGEAKTKVNIVIVGNCKITASKSALNFFDSSMITLSGDGTLDIKAGMSGINIKKADLTIEGLALTIDAKYGIDGNDNEKLFVNGAPISVKGSLGSILGLGDMILKYCDFQDHYDFANNQVEKDGSLATDAVILEPWPMLTVAPVEKGTAKFHLVSKKDAEGDFYDKGWFAKDDEVTITAEMADGFTFGRWTDDADWKDSKKRIGEERKFKMPASNEALSALIYYEAQSDADWFGVNNDKFVRFSFGDNAEKVASATNSLTDVKAGDYVDEEWIFVEGTTVNKFAFDGTLNDGKDILGKDEKIEKYNKKSLSDATDMAYDLINEELFAVSGSKLYRITSSENKEIATFKLESVETTIVSIAVDADGVMYALGLGDGTEGALYTVDIDDKVAKLKPVGKKENGGKIGTKVTNDPQSIAFDLATGELFWGAADYIRVIDVAKMKTFIAGDLGQKEGAQGYIQSLHRMNVAVEVTVEVDKDQVTWGTASVGGETTTAKKPSVSATFVEGAPVTITAEANDGYHFVEWQNADSKKDTHSEASYEFEAEEVTYIAVFAEGGQGIQSITIDPTKNCQKVLIDGTIYIFRDGRVYTVTGERME